METVGLVTPVTTHGSPRAPADHLVRLPDTDTPILAPHALLALPAGADPLGLVTPVLAVRLAVTDLGGGDAGDRRPVTTTEPARSLETLGLARPQPSQEEEEQSQSFSSHLSLHTAGGWAGHHEVG